MPYRVREILLVSSPYDAFILEEDGHLTEQIFTEYKALSLTASPRFTYAPTGEEAIRLMEDRRFDLILTMTSVRDMDFNAFGRRVKALRPGRPVALLVLDSADLENLRATIDEDAIDGVFFWNGDAKILLAIIKDIEDRQNVDFDIAHGGVRVILLLEDSPRFYSSYLAMLYTELMAQSRSLYAEGVNQHHRLMCMKARPKILHADTYEKGVALLRRYERHMLAVITDARLPRAGVADDDAGIDFARLVRAHDAELPILIQSAQHENAARAADLGALFLDKATPNLLAGIRRFLAEHLGFGDFIFRRPDGGEVDRARDLRELEEKLHTVPAESLFFHATRNHFSIWLMARGEFELAERIRPRRVSDYPTVDDVCRFLIDVLRDEQERLQRGMVADFDPAHPDGASFARLCDGGLGGKARGIAFLNMLLAQGESRPPLPMPVRVPPSLVIATEDFDAFMDANNLRDFVYDTTDDREIALRFIHSWLPDELRRQLMHVAARIDAPLAVRSSSLLEDSLQQPFAGIYRTHMIPNNDSSPDERHRQLCTAVKLVYASTFFRNARSYLDNTGYRVEEEKMAVIIERVVGRRRGTRFYPSFSGVAQSYNFYPVGPQKPEDGIVHVALGLGRLIVDGGLALRFSPVHPRVLPQFSTPESVLANTQRGFYAIDLTRTWEGVADETDGSVTHFDLAAAEADGTLDAVGSVFSRDDRRIRDDLGLSGPRVVTFNNILQHGAIPLAETVRELLRMAEDGFGGPVEMEFACEMGDWGRDPPRGQTREAPTLYVLQVRPLVARRKSLATVDVSAIPPSSCLARSNRALGDGVHDGLCDVVYVDPARWDAAHNRAIAAEVGEVNAALERGKRPYILIGPGRWGSADEWLGIPVQWSQIAGVRVMIEASPAGYDVDPSQGTHFFQNITALRIGYLTIPPGADRAQPRDGQFLDWDLLSAAPEVARTAHLRHVRFAQPLEVVLDGRLGLGAVRMT